MLELLIANGKNVGGWTTDAERHFSMHPTLKKKVLHSFFHTLEVKGTLGCCGMRKTFLSKIGLISRIGKRIFWVTLMAVIYNGNC